MVMMFSLMRPDVFSVKDLGLVKGVQKLVPEAKTKESVEKVAERWKPYRTAASWYLWRMQDPVPVEYECDKKFFFEDVVHSQNILKHLILIISSLKPKVNAGNFVTKNMNKFILS